MSAAVIRLLLCLAVPPSDEIAVQVPAALKILNAWHHEDAAPGERELIMVYFTPADRDPAPQYRERLSRVLFDVREFYLSQMQRLGFGDRTLRLQTDQDGLLKIHVVKGRYPAAHYKTESGSEIRRECVPVLKEAGLTADNETIAIFCYLADWDENQKTIRQYSPYYAGGSQRSGTAWQVDSPILDSALLAKTEPIVRDGQYGRISIGKYNSIFVGGVAHELGHALQLPHDHERPDQKAAFGTALMGSGNRTYGSDRRGEGDRSFLTLATALRLASHPMFSGSVKGMQLRPKSEATNVQVEPGPVAFTITANVTGDPPVYTAIAYMDPAGGSDYDATTATAIPDSSGRITLDCNALTAGKTASLRTVLLHCNGAISQPARLQFSYDVDQNGKPDLSSIQAAETLAPLIVAVNSRNLEQAQKSLGKIESAVPSPLVLETARVLLETIGSEKRRTPKDVEGNRCWLSDCNSKSASTGWGRPLANRIPDDSALLMVAGKLHARGLYAHAPARYEYSLGGKWGRFTAAAGLADGHSGTVVVVVKGDGKELFRSKVLKEGTRQAIDVSVKDVQTLDLVVENAEDGNGSDWALWLDPELTR